MKIKDILEQKTLELESDGIGNPRGQAEALLQWCLNKSWSELMLALSSDFPLGKMQILDESMSRLKKGEPLAHIRGYQDFYKYRFLVNEHTLIPRPETEIIVEKCLELKTSETLKIIDLGTGSGCIGLSVAKDLPSSKLWLFDSSEEALSVAQKNRETLGLNNVELIHGQVGIDNFERPELKGQIDFVLANPPYIEWGDERVSESVHDYEPHEALYARNNGLEWIHKWLTWSYDYLKPKAYGMYEFGENQHNDVEKLVEQSSYTKFEFIKDYSDKIRFVLVQK